MGELGVQTVTQLLPEIKKQYSPDFIIAQAENVTNGKGISIRDFRILQELGIDFCTGGNWTFNIDEIYELLNDPSEPIIRPANYPSGTVGRGYKYLKISNGDILIISIIGKIVGKDSDLLLDNPLLSVDNIIDQEQAHPKIATIVNFHGDYSSEKVVIGHYLDGRVTAVLGDHWHVPSSDYRILPKGTAHVSDVGMNGALNSSLGVKLNIIIDRWKNNIKSRNVLEKDGPTQFNAIYVDFEPKTGLAQTIDRIQIYTK